MKLRWCFWALAGWCGALAVSGTASAGATCSANYVIAGAIRTRADVKAFVNCAAEYVATEGTAEARRAFYEDDRWRLGPYYVFVDDIQPTGYESSTVVFPPDPSREGTKWGPLVDRFGDDWYEEAHRIVSNYGSGWIYYAYMNFETGLAEPKLSYLRMIDWDGRALTIGAGIYERDLPGTCSGSDINAAALEANPSEELLEEFVRCAALQLESLGYFAGPLLAQDPRWLHGSIHVFGVDAASEIVLFSGSPSSWAYSGRIRALFDGRDAAGIGAAFGEAYWYYSFTNPADGRVRRKISFVKRVTVQGVPLLVGSGYYLPDVSR